MARLRAEAAKRDLRVQAKSFCVFADACPHISLLECANCFRYFLNLKEYKVGQPSLFTPRSERGMKGA